MVAAPGWPVNVHFPDGTVERVTLWDEPAESVRLHARDQEWRITGMRSPEAGEDVMYEVDVELDLPT